jgi:hypothetical protein
VVLRSFSRLSDLLEKDGNLLTQELALMVAIAVAEVEQTEISDEDFLPGLELAEPYGGTCVDNIW